MTDITVRTTAYQSEKKSWLIPQPGAIGFGFTESGTLDLTKFDAGLSPDGYLRSGTALGIVTASGLLGQYEPAATDGRQKCVGLLFASTGPIAGRTRDLSAYVAAFAVVKTSKLPVASGKGSIDAGAKTALSTIYFKA